MVGLKEDGQGKGIVAAGTCHCRRFLCVTAPRKFNSPPWSRCIQTAVFLVLARHPAMMMPLLPFWQRSHFFWSQGTQTALFTHCAYLQVTVGDILCTSSHLLGPILGIGLQLRWVTNLFSTAWLATTQPSHTVVTRRRLSNFFCIAVS